MQLTFPNRLVRISFTLIHVFKLPPICRVFHHIIAEPKQQKRQQKRQPKRQPKRQQPQRRSTKRRQKKIANGQAVVRRTGHGSDPIGRESVADAIVCVSTPTQLLGGRPRIRRSPAVPDASEYSLAGWQTKMLGV